MAYTEVTASGYNNSPPPDDGTNTSSNRVSWTKIKTGLFDPLKAAIDTINTNIGSAVLLQDTAVATLETSISTLSSLVANLSTTLGAPQGTAKLFRQTTPPTGWTKGTSFDDYALRLVTGTASSGGSTAFTSVFTARTITSSNMPNHNHSFSDSSSVSFSSATTFLDDVSDDTTTGDAAGSSTRITNVADDEHKTPSGTYSFSTTTSSAGSGSSWDFAVQYVDTIYATKS